MRNKLLKFLVTSVIAFGITVVSGLNANAAEPETAWNTWTSNTSNSVNWHSSNNDAVQDGEYIYYATSGNHTSIGAQYETIGTMLSYGSDYVYCGGSGVRETFKSFTSGGTDYVMHRIAVSDIYNNMPQVKSDLLLYGRIQMRLDPVYAPLIEGSLKATIDGVRSKSLHASTDYENTAQIPNNWSTAWRHYPDWSTTALGILANSFNHPITITRPPSLRVDPPTVPRNRGINYLTGIAKSGIKEGEAITNESFKNLYWKSGYSNFWTKSNTTFILGVSSQQPIWTGDSALAPLNSLTKTSVEMIDTSSVLNSVTYTWATRTTSGGTETHTNHSNRTLPGSWYQTPLREILADFKAVEYVPSWANASYAGTDYYNSAYFGFKAAYTTKVTDTKFSINQCTVSHNGKVDDWENVGSCTVDDYGPTWDNLAINPDGYTGSNVFTFTGIKDFAGPSLKLEGAGFKNFSYCAYGDDKEPSSKKFTEISGNSVTIDFDSKELSQSANVVLELKGYDNLGNETSKKYTLPASKPKPETVVNLRNAPYKDPDSNDVWFSTNHSMEIVVNTSVQPFVKQFPNATNINLVNTDKTKKSFSLTMKDPNGYLGVRKALENDFKINVTSNSSVRVDDRNTYISYLIFSGLEHLNNQKFRITGNGSIDSDGIIYTSETVEEKDGELFCIDSQSPTATLEVAGINKASFTASDKESGVKSVAFYNADSGALIRDVQLSKTKKENFITAGTYVFDATAFKDARITMIVTDNVGNKYTKTYEKFETTTYSGDITNRTVTQDGKTYMEVSATGQGKNPPFGDKSYFTFYLNGQGYKVNNSSDTIAVKQTPSMSYTGRIPDDVNTTEAPVISYSTGAERASLNWNKLEDVTEEYSYSLTADVGPTDLGLSVATHSFSFSTGYKEYGYRIWKATDEEYAAFSDSQTPPSRDCDAEGSVDALSLDMSRFVTGKYLVEVVMYDGNKNPSGKGVIAVDHVQPTLQLPLALNVTAVKDINWENIRRPFEYSKFQTDSSIEQPVITQGEDFGLFSLGTVKDNSRGISGPISLGYTVNYSMARTTTDLAKVNISYKFISEDGKQLKLRFNGKSLDELDIANGTNYVSQEIKNSDSRWSDFTSTEGYLVKHLIPSGSKATLGANPYEGNISVVAELTFTAITGEVSDPVKVPLYTVTTKRTAEDDLVSDKIR